MHSATVPVLHMLTHKCAGSAETIKLFFKLVWFKILYCHLLLCVLCEEQVQIVSEFKLQRVNRDVLKMRWKQILHACTVQTFPLMCMSVQSCEPAFLFPSFSALIKSDLRRHNVNSGIMNLDVKAVSGDSFTIIVLPTWILDFYWHNNISCKRVNDKILWLIPCWFWTRESHGMLPSHICFSP